MEASCPFHSCGLTAWQLSSDRSVACYVTSDRLKPTSASVAVQECPGLVSEKGVFERCESAAGTGGQLLFKRARIGCILYPPVVNPASKVAKNSRAARTAGTKKSIVLAVWSSQVPNQPESARWLADM